jgi:WD40 repeat protein
MQDDIIATGSADKTVKIWSKQNGLCLKTFYVDTKFSIISLSLDKSFIVFSTNSLILLIKYEKHKHSYSFKKIQEFKEHFRRFALCFKFPLTIISITLGKKLILELKLSS